MRSQHYFSLLLLAPVLGLAQSSGSTYVMKKGVIAGGGQQASALGTVLVGTVGQAAAGAATGGSYALTGGFHGPTTSAVLPAAIFRNGFEG